MLMPSSANNIEVHRRNLESHRRYYQRHKKEVYIAAKKYRKEHPEKIKEFKHRFYQKHKLKIHLERYNLTVENYYRMLELQGNKCAVCHEVFVEKHQIDHNHKTGKVRELLCRRCNILVGFMEHNLVEKALKYLEEVDK